MDIINNPEYGISSFLLDYIIMHQIKEIAPKQVVDLGAGGGKNGRLIKESLGNRCRLVAIEGYEKTVQMLVEQGLYHEVHHELLQDWIQKDSHHYDLAIFGDVLEHLTPKEIHCVIKQSITKFDHIIITSPLYDIFQEQSYNNPLEVHRTYLTSSFFDRYNPIEKHLVHKRTRSGIDLTMMNVCISTKKNVNPIYRRISWPILHSCMMVIQPLGMARPFVNFLKRYFLKYKWLIRG
jgi:hypothetical protein